MRIFELDQNKVAAAATGAVGGSLMADSVRRAVKNFMAARGEATFKKRMVGQAVPGVGLILGLVFAAQRYATKPDDYIGMGLDLASGVAGLGTALAVLPVQMARDAYSEVVTDLHTVLAPQRANYPAVFALKGFPERDAISDPTTFGEIMSIIQDEIRKSIAEAQAKVAEWEKLSTGQRNDIAQAKADELGPEAGAAQAARAAATQRMNRSARRTPPQ